MEMTMKGPTLRRVSFFRLFFCRYGYVLLRLLFAPYQGMRQDIVFRLFVWLDYHGSVGFYPCGGGKDSQRFVEGYLFFRVPNSALFCDGKQEVIFLQCLCRIRFRFFHIDADVIREYGRDIKNISRRNIMSMRGAIAMAGFSRFFGW